MSDLAALVDFEFHFTSGEVLRVDTKEGEYEWKNAVSYDGTLKMALIVRHPSGETLELTLEREKLNCWQKTSRPSL